MNENHFNILMKTLAMIEQNTRKKEFSTLSTPPPLFIDEAIKQVQELFFSKLQVNSRWTQEGVKKLFIESVKIIREPISVSSIEDLF